MAWQEYRSTHRTHVICDFPQTKHFAQPRLNLKRKKHRLTAQVTLRTRTTLITLSSTVPCVRPASSSLRLSNTRRSHTQRTHTSAEIPPNMSRPGDPSRERCSLHANSTRRTSPYFGGQKIGGHIRSHPLLAAENCGSCARLVARNASLMS